MSEHDFSPTPPPADPGAAPTRPRAKPGERKLQILHTLASMLERPGSERVTTAALAARLQVSEAALYRHFASKAQMFEGLIEFIESSVLSLVNQIAEKESEPGRRLIRSVAAFLQFSEKNPGISRVMSGDALVFEHERLQERMNRLFDKLESHFKQCLRESAVGLSAAPDDAQAQASVIVSFCMGRVQRYGRSNFQRRPTEHLDASLVRLTSQ